MATQRSLTLAVLSLAAVLSLSGGVSADSISDPYQSDPLGLVAHYDLTSTNATGETPFEVWICDTHPDFVTPPEAVADAVQLLGGTVSDYWKQLSNGRWTVSFVSGGVVSQSDDPHGCVGAAGARSSGDNHAALVLRRSAYRHTGVAGWGSPGRWCYDRDAFFWCERDSTFPQNRRYALIVMSADGQLSLSTVLHEMGHAAGFPHSFTGLLPLSDQYREYDNFMDIMSGGSSREVMGTPAVNRYAAGWFEPSQVTVYRGGAGRVVLSADWSSTNSVQMVALPTDTPGLWLSLGARTHTPFDQVPVEGVEAYVIDQTGAVCPEPSRDTCWGASRSTTPYPVSPDDPVAHVVAVGQQITWRGVTIKTTQSTEEGFVVELSDGAQSLTGGAATRFADTAGSGHEADIELIAQLGITVGCATEPQPRFCPERPVTRAEMAAFLLRASGLDTMVPARTFAFSDVADDRWYTNYVHVIAELGIDTGTDGQWRPREPLTRLEMAYWLVGVFEHIEPAGSPRGLFGDVQPEHGAAVEGMYHTGVTRGCSTEPLLYCPDRSVTRAEMASFVIRALS
ncbi:MAG: S-layer homology domain-containing protein [bacterium]|nr:S-layer homology domain-containing protein [bacterium]